MVFFAGLKDTNVEGDLVVEHYNCEFKVCVLGLHNSTDHSLTQEILENLKGNYDAETIESMAVSLEVRKELEAKLLPNYER